MTYVDDLYRCIGDGVEYLDDLLNALYKLDVKYPNKLAEDVLVPSKIMNELLFAYRKLVS